MRIFLECGRRCAPFGLSTLSGAPWRAEAALVHAALGDPGQARRLAGEQLTLARAFGRPRTLGVSLRACGLIEGGESGRELLREAVQTLERSQSPLELARALSDHGARRIAAGARAELIAAGAKPRRDAITGRDALTAGELLFITTKTAKGHLNSVYRKLEITRRGQLTDALAGLLRDGGEDPGAAAAIS